MSKILAYTEAEMMQSFCEGKERGYAAIFKLMYPRLCSYIHRFVQREDVAEDIAQDTLVKLWERRCALYNFPQVKSFLFITAHNAACDWLKIQKRHLRIENDKVKNRGSSGGAFD